MLMDYGVEGYPPLVITNNTGTSMKRNYKSLFVVTESRIANIAFECNRAVNTRPCVIECRDPNELTHLQKTYLYGKYLFLNLHYSMYWMCKDENDKLFVKRFEIDDVEFDIIPKK
jgi:hypothetical protein